MTSSLKLDVSNVNMTFRDLSCTSVISDFERRKSVIATLVSRLPPVNYRTLANLIMHLDHIVWESNINKMEPSNLAVIFAPTLLRSQDESQDAMANMTSQTQVVETMINGIQAMFSP